MKEFIPKPYKTEQISFRIDSDKLKRIDQLAFDNNISRAQFINQCIDFAMEHMPAPDETPHP